MLKFDKYSVLILVLFLALIGARVYNMTADPPSDLSWSGGLFFDEGALAHNARNQVLFGEWETDEWNDFYYSPILSYIKWAIFAAFGVGMWQLRLVSLLFTTGTLAVIYSLIKKSHGRLTAALGMTLLGGNYLYLMYSRLGLTEISVAFLAVLTLYCWGLGMAAQTGWQRGLWMVLAGSSCFMVFIFKTLLIYFLPVPFVSLAFWGLIARTPTERKRILSMMLWGLVGLSLTATIWLVVFYYPNYASIQQAGDFVKMLSLPKSPDDFVGNVSNTPFFHIFSQTPIHLVLSIGYFIFLAYRLLHDRVKLSPIDVFAAFWFLAHLVFFLGYGYRPVRYYVPIIPAMSMLTARALTGMLSLSTRKLPFLKPSVWFWGVTWGIGIVLSGVILRPLAERYGGFEHFSKADAPAALWVSGVAALLGVLFVAAVFHRYRGAVLWGMPGIARAIGGLFLIGCVWANGTWYVEWARNAEFTVRDISRELGRMLDHAYIAGLPTPMLSMENTHRALYVWDNFANAENTFEKYPVTHLFLGKFNGELAWYYRNYPEVMKRATLLKSYWLKGWQFYLLSLVEPSFDRVKVSRDAYAANESVQIRFDLRNNDPRQARDLAPGIVVVERDAPDAPLLTVNDEVALPPSSEREIAFSFTAPPGTYEVLATVFSETHAVHEAETLLSQGGDVVVDSDASGGKSRYAPAGFGGFLTYGPYQLYPAGLYTAEFLIKGPDGQRSEDQPLALLEVTTDAGQTILAQKAVRISDIRDDSTFHAMPVSFIVQQAAALEFRVIPSGTREFWVDAVRVTFFQGRWSASPIIVESLSP